MARDGCRGWLFGRQPINPLTAGQSGGWAVRGLIVLLAAAVFVGYLIHEQSLAGALGFSSDDAWIHFRFAHNLIFGHSFSFNPGEPVAGSTAPLWTLICAGFLSVFRNPVWAGKIAGFLCWVVLLWGVFALVRELTGSKIAAWGGTLLTLFHPRVIWGALSGLEVMLSSALIVWAIVLHFRASGDSPRPYYPVTLLLFLASLTRPELFALIPIFWVDRWWLGRIPNEELPNRWREIAVSLGTGALVLAPYLAFNLWTIGKPLPLTFYAKLAPTGIWAALASGQPGTMMKAVLSSGVEYLYQTYARFLLIELPGMAGCWYLLWHLGTMSRPARRKAGLLVAIPLYFLLVHAIFTSGIQGAFARYLMILYPLLACVAVTAGWHWWNEPRPLSRKFLIASGGLVLGVAVPIILAVSTLPPLKLFWLVIYPPLNWMPDSIRAAMSEDQFLAGQTIALLMGVLSAGFCGVLCAAVGPPWGKRLIGAVWVILGMVVLVGVVTWAPTDSLAVKNINDLNVAAGRWLEANLPPGTSIAVNDIGAIGYFAGGHHIIDLMGLVEPEILPYRKRGEGGIWEFVKLKQPDYLAVFDTWFPALVAHTETLELVHSVHAANYILWGYHTISIYRANWD